MAWTWLDLLLFSASVYGLAWLVTCSKLVDHASAQGSLSSGRRARGYLARAQAHEPDTRGEGQPHSRRPALGGAHGSEDDADPSARIG